MGEQWQIILRCPLFIARPMRQIMHCSDVLPCSVKLVTIVVA